MTRQLTREQFTKEFGITPDTMAREMDDYASSRRYLDEHWEDLLRLYPGEFVAVRDSVLVGHAPTMDALLASLDAHGISRAHTVFDFLDAGDVIMILAWR